MTNGRFGATLRDIGTLMKLGAIGHLTDGELLDRFIERREGGEAAFEALVARHGSMVLGVCRRVLGSFDMADDAFQATFLVLVRQAGSIRKRESLGPWLHGVARRISLRARRDATRRRDRERLGFRVVGGDETDEALTETLRDEIDRLPEKYRTPIVLCDLEGQTHAEAAEQLHWPIGTVSGRLSRARALLRTRIARRGLALTIATYFTILRSEANAHVSRELTRRAIQSATSMHDGQVIPSLTSTMVQASLRQNPAFLARVMTVAASIGIACGGLVYNSSRSVTPRLANATPQASMIREVRSHTAPRRKIENETEIIAIALAPDGLTLASGSTDAVVTLWDLQTGLEKVTMIGHSAAVRSLAFTRDGRMLASKSDDHTIRFWDVGSGRETLAVTWLEIKELAPRDLGLESLDSDRVGTGRDCCADGPAREADSSGA